MRQREAAWPVHVEGDECEEDSIHRDWISDSISDSDRSKIQQRRKAASNALAERRIRAWKDSDPR